MNKHHSSKSPPTPTSQLLFFLEPRQLNQSPPISGFFHPVRHRAHSLPQIGSVFWAIPILLGVNMLIHTYISSVQYLILSHDSQVLSEEWPLRKVDVGILGNGSIHTWTQLGINLWNFPPWNFFIQARSRMSLVALNCPILSEGML